MPDKNIKVPEETYRLIVEIKKKTEISIRGVVKFAVMAYYRRHGCRAGTPDDYYPHVGIKYQEESK